MRAFIVAITGIIVTGAAHASTAVQPAPGSRIGVSMRTVMGNSRNVEFCDGGEILFAQATNDGDRVVPLTFVDASGRAVSSDAIVARLATKTAGRVKIYLACGR